MRVRRPLPLLLVAVALAVSGCDNDDSPLGILGGGTSEPNATDAAYTRAMIPHQKETLAMAELARNRALRKELRKIAKSMLGARRGELERLGTIGAELTREGVRPAGTRMARKPAPVRDLRDPVSFDHLFMSLMIRHLEGAIAMAEEEQDRGGHARLRRLAAEIQKSQNDALEQLRRWLRTWYGGTLHPGAGGGGGGGEGEQPAPDGEGGDEGPGGGEDGGQPEGPPI